MCGKQTGPGFKPDNELPCPLESGHEGYCQRPDDPSYWERVRLAGVVAVDRERCIGIVERECGNRDQAALIIRNIRSGA